MSSPLITLTFTSTYNPESSFSVTFNRVIQGRTVDYANIDAGAADSVYGGINTVDCGGA